MSEDALLTVSNLVSKLKMGKQAYSVVNDISFVLKKGKTLALVGESGCGKSLTALSILRVLPTPPALPSEGEVIYQGRNLLKLSEDEMRKIRGYKISMIFQDPRGAFNPVYTIGTQLMEVATYHLGLEGKQAQQAAIEALNEVHLPHPEQRMKEYPHQLSGGMLQRAMIAMALIGKPDILIADEPTTALDVSLQGQILGLLEEIKEKRGMAILLITHDMGVVAETADEVIVMYASQKIEQASTQELFDNPAHPYTQGLFLSSVDRPLSQGRLPQIKGQVPPLTAIPKGCRFHPRCPDAMPICSEKEPPTFSLATGEHTAKCWLFDPELEQKLDHEDDSGS